jgi:hypothetical protein
MIYISGSITGASPAERMLFHHAEQELSNKGYSSFNPLNHDIPAADTNEDAWIGALTRDIIVILQQCRGICVLDTFERSKGALLECFVAVSMNRPIILLGHQSSEWRGKVIGLVRAAQERLWYNVDGSKYPHHTVLPVTAFREVSQR